MGIQGLLPFLKKCSRPTTLAEFRGMTAAIDAYCWLHKGAFSCADKLVKGEPTVGYILYMMKQINILLSFNIKPILVFDGCHLPSKASTENKRRENREKNKKKAKELLREGRTKEAHECFQRCVDVTSEMAREVIEACRERNVDIIVAPYEADAQLAFLNIKKIADFVITEDSDLVLFGCDKILFKMDSNGGGILVERDKLHLGMGLPRDKFSYDRFLYMCVMSGCDYLPSLPGIGLGKACKFFSVTTNPDVYNVLSRIPSYLKMSSLEVTQEYRDNFMKAINTFYYQLVFDPINRTLGPLNPYPADTSAVDYPYAGKHVGHDRGLQIALGNINVQTGEVVDSYDPLTAKFKKTKSSSWKLKGDIIASHPSIWKPDYPLKWANNTTPKVESKVPVLNASSSTSTLGKQKIIPSPTVKRKLSNVTEDSTGVSDDDLQAMYGIKMKRQKSVGHIKEEDTSQVGNLMQAIDEFEESPKKNPSELKSPTTPSKNPFLKKSEAPVSKFKSYSSAIKNFSQLKTENKRTIVKSRFFSSPKLANQNSKEVDQSDDKDQTKEVDYQLEHKNNSQLNHINELDIKQEFKENDPKIISQKNIEISSPKKIQSSDSESSFTNKNKTPDKDYISKNPFAKNKLQKSNSQESLSQESDSSDLGLLSKNKLESPNSPTKPKSPPISQSVSESSSQSSSSQKSLLNSLSEFKCDINKNKSKLFRTLSTKSESVFDSDSQSLNCSIDQNSFGLTPELDDEPKLLAVRSSPFKNIKPKLKDVSPMKKNSSPMKKSTNSSKVSGKCGRIGLSKSGTKSKQPTLTQMFGFSKKKVT